jgi:hypothetical protein
MPTSRFVLLVLGSLVAAACAGDGGDGATCDPAAKPSNCRGEVARCDGAVWTCNGCDPSPAEECDCWDACDNMYSPYCADGVWTCGDPGTGGCGGTGAAGGSGGVGGTGGSGGGAGAGAGGGGGAGGGECTPVTLDSFVDVLTEQGGSNLIYDITGLDAASEDVLFIEFYDVAGAQTAGDFDLSQAPDDQYQTCAHCLVAYENFNDASPPAFFQQSGILHVTTPDIGYAGTSAGSFENVKLIEVTIQGTVSTPVPGGRCLVLNGSWDRSGG